MASCQRLGWAAQVAASRLLPANIPILIG